MAAGHDGREGRGGASSRYPSLPSTRNVSCSRRRDGGVRGVTVARIASAQAKIRHWDEVTTLHGNKSVTIENGSTNSSCK